MMSVRHSIRFELNEQPVTVSIPVTMDALTMLRDVLKLTGTKRGCEEGECGACTILVDGASVNACLMFAVECDGRAITTIEGLRSNGALNELQRAFVDAGAVQCGYCTPGLIVQAASLLSRGSPLTRDQIKRGIEGNLCRCTGYRKVLDAIESAFDTADHASERTP